MSPRSALPLASLLLVALAACPASSVASPRPEAAVGALPENPLPATVSPTTWSVGSFQPASQFFRNALYSQASSPAEAPCHCLTAPAPKNVAFTLTTYSSNGNIMIDLPRIPGTPNAPIGSAHWGPRHLYAPLVGGFRSSQRKMDQLLTGKLFDGVSSNLRSVLHLGSASNH